MKEPRIPTTAETLDFIRTQGLRAAERTIVDIRLVETAGNEITLGRGTPLSTTLRKSPAGNIAAVRNETNTNWPLVNQQPPCRPSRFQLLIEHIQQTAIEAVLLETQAWLGILPSTRCGEDQGTLQAIYESKTVRTAARKTGTKATGKHPDLAGDDDPIERAHRVLTNYIGNSKVRAAKKLLGEGATIRHLLEIQPRMEAVRAYARRQHNEVLMWARYESPPKLHGKLRAVFQTTTKQLLEKDLHGYPPEKQPDLKEILDNLDTKAILHATGAQAHEIAELCKKVNYAGVQPSYEAAIHLLRNTDCLITTPFPLLRYFIKQSADPAEQTPEAQRTLVAQFNVLRRFAEPHNKRRKNLWDTTHIDNAVSFFNSSPPAWNELVGLLPPWARSVRSQEDVEQIAHMLPTPRLRRPYANLAQAKLETPHASDVCKLAAHRAVLTHTIIGKRTAITSPHTARPYIVAERQEDGRITLWDQNGRQDDTPIPYGEALEERYTHMGGSMALTAYLHHASYNLAGHVINTHWPSWAPHPFRKVPTGVAFDVTRSKSSLNLRIAPIDWPSSQKTLTNLFNRGAKTLVDAPTRARTNRLLSTSSIDEWSTTYCQYNTVLTMREGIEELQRTNPGAVPLGLRFIDHQGPVQHPGHFISLTREALTKAGLLPENWRFAARMDPAVITSMAINPLGRLHLIGALNNMARAQVVPSPSVASMIVNRAHGALRPTGRHAEGCEEACAHNLYILTKLASQESRRLAFEEPGEPPQADLSATMVEVIDYLSQKSKNEGVIINATTWRSLLRRATEWHGRRRQGGGMWENLARAAKRRASSDEPPAAWDSALPETRSEGYTFVPLCDEDQLIQESLDMRHCVYQYASACLQDNTRLFSVRRDGDEVATVELSLNGREWNPAQSRGPDNSPVEQEIKDLTAHLARLYTNAWMGQPATKAS